MEQELNPTSIDETAKPIDPASLNIEPTDPKPRNLIKMILLFVVAPLIVATFLFLSWGNLRKLNSPDVPIIDTPSTSVTPSTNVEPSVAPSTEKSELKTERNEKLGVEIRIPKTWNLQPQATEEAPIARYVAPDNSSFEVFTADTTLKTLNDYITKIDADNKTGWEGSPSKEVIETKMTKIATFPAVTRKERFLAADFVTVVTYVMYGTKVYTFTVIPNADDAFETQEAAKNYDAVLSSLKFLN